MECTEIGRNDILQLGFIPHRFNTTTVQARRIKVRTNRSSFEANKNKEREMDLEHIFEIARKKEIFQENLSLGKVSQFENLIYGFILFRLLYLLVKLIYCYWARYILLKTPKIRFVILFLL
jgi:hypothetical protein